MPDAEHYRGGRKVTEPRKYGIRRGIRSQVIHELNFRFEGKLFLHQFSSLLGSDQRAGKNVVGLHLQLGQASGALFRPVDAFRREGTCRIVAFPLHHINGDAMSE